MKSKPKFRAFLISILFFLISFFSGAHPAAANNDFPPATPGMEQQTTAHNPQQFSQLLAQNSADSDSAREKRKNLTPEQKDALRKKYKKWKNLSPEKKAEIRKKYKKFKDLPPEEQQKIKRNWKRYQKLSDEERKAIRKKHKFWQRLSEEEKQQLKTRMRKYRQMTPEERQRIKEKRKKWQNLSPERKKQLREEYKKRHRKKASEVSGETQKGDRFLKANVIYPN
jgi:hypothetical protein